MKRILGTTFVLLALTVTAALGGQSGGVGTWDITIESPNGQRTSMLVIKKDGDKLTGALKSPRGERPLDSVTVKGDDISFVMTAQVGGQDMVMTYKGKIGKDSMKGDADFGGMATGTWSAVPHKEDAAAGAAGTSAAPGVQVTGLNISGAWSFTVETQAGSGSPTFTFKQEGETLTGTYKGQFGEAPLTGTVKGNNINFSIKVNAQGQDVTIVYSGAIESKDSMKGKVSIAEMGEGTWTAKRK